MQPEFLSHLHLPFPLVSYPTPTFVPLALTNNPTHQHFPGASVWTSHTVLSAPHYLFKNSPSSPHSSTTVPPVQVGKGSSYRHLRSFSHPTPPAEVDHTLFDYLRPRQSGRKLSPKSLTELNGLEPTQNCQSSKILAP